MRGITARELRAEHVGRTVNLGGSDQGVLLGHSNMDDPSGWVWVEIDPGGLFHLPPSFPFKLLPKADSNE